MELSKKEKQLARELIAKGLQEDLKRGLSTFETMLQEWRGFDGDQRDPYNNFCDAVKDYRKSITERYDNRFISITDLIVLQLRDKLYDFNELNIFRAEIKEDMIRTLKIWDDWNKK
jgi:hypothetical protein